jgi:hypothetical protein
MALKNKFPKKLVEIKPNLSFEEMQEKMNSPESIEEPDFEQEPVKDEVIQELHSAPKKLPKEIHYNQVVEESIPKSQIDDYIDKKWEEKLKTLTIPEPKKEVPASKKVESVDDLPEFENWEEKDRIYILCSGFSSLSQGIKDRHKKGSPLMYKGRSLRYSTSQASFFMDKQIGDVLTTYLSIEEGKLMVPKSNTHLQKFLAIHPDNGVVFKEFDPKNESKAVYEAQNLKLDAHLLSRQIDTPTLVAVAMLMYKDYNEGMDLFTVKRELYNEIENNPKLFIKLASDQNLKLKSTGKIAVFRGFLSYANFRFYDEEGKVICEANRNENEYDSLAAYFGTAEGRSLYDYLVQKIEN